MECINQYSSIKYFNSPHLGVIHMTKNGQNDGHITGQKWTNIANIWHKIGKIRSKNIERWTKYCTKTEQNIGKNGQKRDSRTLGKCCTHF